VKREVTELLLAGVLGPEKMPGGDATTFEHAPGVDRLPNESF